MENNKRFLLTVVLAVIFALSMTLFVACGHTGADNGASGSAGDTSASDTSGKEEQQFSATGDYYFTAPDGNEYLLMFNGTTFTLLLDEGSVSGTMVSDDEVNITLKTSTGLTYSAVLSGDTAALIVGENAYNFLRRVRYTVTYETNGGSAVTPVSVLNGSTISKPADPVRDGYDFIAWYEDAEFKKAHQFDAPVTANTKLYARFVEKVVGGNEYKAQLVLNGQVYAELTTIGGKLYNLPEPEGDFIGWWVSDFENADKLTYKYDEQTLTEDAVLYAVYKTDGVAVSVNDGVVSWTEKGANSSYLVTIVKPDKTVTSARVNTLTEYNYDFDQAGEYEISVVVDDEVTTVYYNGKALDKVSVFGVVGSSVLTFNSVANAEKYLISIDCGNSEHEHTLIDNGKSTNYNFANCDMQVGGIKFTVTAVAAGYVSSTSKTFVYEKNLDAVTGLKVSADHLLEWNYVENALNYAVTVKHGGDEDVYYTDENSLSLKNYHGELNITVEARMKGYNPSSAALDYNKLSLAAPANVSLEGRTLSWDSVEGATSYNIYFGNTVKSVTESSYTLTDDLFTGEKDAYELYIQSVSASADLNSQYSDAVVLNYGKMSAVTYSNGVATWDYVLDATRYVVSVNGANGQEIPADKNFAAIEFTKSGYNTISVYYVNSLGLISDTAALDVYAYAVNFDVRGGTRVDDLYLAKGDVLVLPDTTFDGYDFGGWYNLPTGAEGNASLYKEGLFDYVNDINAYAYWIPKKYLVSLVYDNGTGGQEEVMVSFGRDYNFGVPETSDALKTFTGWYTDHNAHGIAYTSSDGSSLSSWKLQNGLTLYAGWMDMFTFYLSSDGETYSVSPGEGMKFAAEVTVPVTYNGKYVTQLNSQEFKSLTMLEVLNIPDTVGIMSISAQSFVNCSSFREINVYRTNIAGEKKYASADGVLLYRDSDLDTVTVVFGPSGKTGALVLPSDELYFGTDLDGNDILRKIDAIGDEVFSGCKLSAVVIPSSVKYVGNRAFYNSRSITLVTFEQTPSGEEEVPLTIGEYAFYYNIVLASVTLPSRLESFNPSDNVFYYCVALTDINVVGENGNYTSKDGLLLSADGTTLVYCPLGIRGELRLPNTVTGIGEEAFKSTRVSTLYVPARVTEIAERAFTGSSVLSNVVFEGDADSPELTIRSYAFYGATNLRDVVLPENTALVESYAFGNTSKLTKVTLKGNENTVIENGAFQNDYVLDNENKTTKDTKATSYVTTLVIGKTMGVINISSAFGNDRLSAVTVEQGNPNYWADETTGVLYNADVTSIAFVPLRTSGLYTTPGTVTTIPAGTFEGRTALTKIVVGKNVTSIGEGAFYDCNKVTVFEFEAGGEQPLTIADRAFMYCRNLESIAFPERTYSVGDFAFSGCGKLATVNLPSTLEKLGAYTLVDGLPTSDKMYNVFNGCNVLANIHVAENNDVFTSIDGILYGKTNGVVTDLYFSPKKDGDIVIPYTVTKVWENAFYNNKNITSVSFSEAASGVQLSDLEIGANAFAHTGAKSIVLRNGTKTIGENAFYFDEKLTNLVLPDGITYIGTGAFNSCVSLESIVLPEGITEISVEMFKSCLKLKTVTVPSTVTSMKYDAFNGCKALEEVIFAETPAGQEEVELRLEDGVGVYNVNNVFQYYGGVFANCPRLSEVALPGRTTYIGSYAFYYMSSLQTAVIPANVTEIGARAFMQSSTAKSLTTLTFAADSKLEKIGDYAFNYTLLSGRVDLPGSVKEIGQYAFDHVSGMTGVTLPEGLTTLGVYAFSNSGLTSVVIPSSLTSLGNYVFYADANLESVTLPASLTSIGNYAFYGATKLEEIAIPGKVTSIGNYAFYNCSALTAVSFEKNEGATSLTSIGNYAFSGAGLTQIAIPATVTTIGTYAFQNNKQLALVTFETGEGGKSALSSVGNYAFYNCSALTAVSFPETTGNLTLGTYLLSGCTNLESVNVSSTVTGTLNAATFTNCNKLTSLTVAEGNANFSTNDQDAQSILYNAVNPGTGKPTAIRMILGSINGAFEIPDGIQELDASLFAGQTGLTKVTVPATVRVIGGLAFSGCTGLTEVVFADAENSALETIRAQAFQNCSALTSITLPASLKNLGTSSTTADTYSATAGGQVFSGCKNLKSVVLSEGLENIGYRTFYTTTASNQCTQLTSVTVAGDETGLTLPTTIKNVGNEAFRRTGLTKVRFPNANAVYGSQNTTVTTSVTNATSTTAINGGVFAQTPVTTIEFAEGLTKFSDNLYNGSNMFNACTSLTKVTFPTSFTTIPSGMFIACTGLTEVTVPASVTALGAHVFRSCTNLTKATFEGDVATPGTYAFYGDTKLTTVVLPDGMKRLGSAWFYGCSALKYIFVNEAPETLPAESSVTLPSSLEWIGAQTFYNCKALTKITIPQSVIGIINGTPEFRDAFITATGQTFYGCTGLTEVVFEGGKDSNLSYLGANTFQGCTGLTYIELPRNTRVLGNSSFTGCTKLAEVVLPDNTEKVGERVFENATSLVTVYVPDTFEKFNHYMFNGCTSLKNIVTFTSRDELAEYRSGAKAFDEYNTLPSALISLGTYTFQNCKALEAITIPAGVLSLSGMSMDTYTGDLSFPPSNNTYYYTSYLFSGSGIKDIRFAEGVNIELIGRYAFQNCTNLVSIRLPEGVKQIAAYAFAGCTNLETVYLPSSLQYIGGANDNLTNIPNNGYVFSNNTSLKTVSFASNSNLAIISAYTFQNCTSLETIALPESLTVLGNYAFYKAGLKAIELPGGIATFGNFAFAENSQLETVVFSEALSALSEHAFENDVLLNKVVLPANVNSIANYAFRGCSSLNDITFTGAVTAIGQEAFKDCALTEIEFADTTTTIGNGAFYGNDIKRVFLPASVSDMAGNAFGNNLNLTGYEVDPESAAYYAEDGILYDLYRAIVAFPASIGGDVSLEGVEVIGDYAFDGCTEITSITFDENLRSIGTYAFNNVALAKLDIPETLTEISDGAFAGIIVGELVLPEGITAIGANAFKDASIDNLVLNDGIETIGESAFENFVSSGDIILPDGVKTVGANLFRRAKVHDIYIPAGVEFGLRNNSTVFDCTSANRVVTNSWVVNTNSYSNTLFYDDGHEFYMHPESVINEFVIGAGVTDLPVGFGMYCNAVKLIIEAPMTRVNSGDFSYMGYLVEVVLPEGLETFGDPNDTYMGAYNLFNDLGAGYMREHPFRKVNVPSTITNFCATSNGGPFSDNDFITTIVMADGLTAITDYAFKNLKAVTSLNIPASVTSIGTGAFQVGYPLSAASLTSLVISKNVTKMGSSVFSGWTASSTIYVEFTEDEIPAGWASDWKAGCNATIVYGYNAA